MKSDFRSRDRFYDFIPWKLTADLINMTLYLLRQNSLSVFYSSVNQIFARS